MPRSLPLSSLALVALSASGCALLVSTTRDPAALAATQERDTCPGTALDPAVLSPASVERVEPFLSRLPSKSGHDTHLRGAWLAVRPSPGLTPELLERALRCHGARQALGREPARPDDPYGWPGAAVEIRATSTGAGFRVELSSDETAQARQILARARAWAARGQTPGG